MKMNRYPAEKEKGNLDLQRQHPARLVAVASRAETRVESVVVIPAKSNQAAPALMFLGNSARRKRRAERGKNPRFCNPKGIVSFSPGLLAPSDELLERPGCTEVAYPTGRGTSYPGSRAEWITTPTGLCLVFTDEPQPRWGCLPSATFPRVARSSQPWALSRNPVGIQLWNFRKTLPPRQTYAWLNNG